MSMLRFGKARMAFAAQLLNSRPCGGFEILFTSQAAAWHISWQSVFCSRTSRSTTLVERLTRAEWTPPFRTNWVVPAVVFRVLLLKDPGQTPMMLYKPALVNVTYHTYVFGSFGAAVVAVCARMPTWAVDRVYLDQRGRLTR